MTLESVVCHVGLISDGIKDSCMKEISGTTREVGFFGVVAYPDGRCNHRRCTVQEKLCVGVSSCCSLLYFSQTFNVTFAR